MPVTTRDLRSRLYDLLYLRIPGLQADTRVGQALLTRTGFGNWVGHIPVSVSAAVWCDQALDRFVDAYPVDTCQKLDEFLQALATLPMLGLYEPSPDDLLEIQACRDEIVRLSCEELCRQLAPGRWARAATSAQNDLIVSLLAAERGRLAAATPMTVPAAIVPTPEGVFAQFNMEDQVKAFTEAYPGYATGGIYQCVMSGDDSVIANWLVPRLLAEIMPKGKRVRPQPLWLTDADLPAAEGGDSVFEILNQKVDAKLSRDLTELVSPGREPCLVLIRTSSATITAGKLGELACRCCADAAFQKLTEQARRNAVLLIVGWAGMGRIEPAEAQRTGVCAIAVGDMKRSELRRRLRDCLQALGVPDADINRIVDDWSQEVGTETGPAKLIYEATREVLSGR